VLRCRIRGGRSLWAGTSQPEHRGIVDYNSLASSRGRVQRLLLQHLPYLCSLTQEDTVEIHGDDVLPVVVVDVNRLPRLAPYAGVIDAYIYPTELLDGLINGRIHGILVASVQLDLDDFHVFGNLLKFRSRNSQRQRIDVAQSELAHSISDQCICRTLPNAL